MFPDFTIVYVYCLSDYLEHAKAELEYLKKRN